MKASFRPAFAEPINIDIIKTQKKRKQAFAQVIWHYMYIRTSRQVHKVLGMEQLPPPKQWRFARKRRRDSSSGEAGESAGEEKKDKKEEMAE